MECLEKVEKRQADFVAVDPEDMYVAFQMKNEDFAVFAEIREDPDGMTPFEFVFVIFFFVLQQNEKQ